MTSAPRLHGPSPVRLFLLLAILTTTLLVTRAGGQETGNENRASANRDAAKLVDVPEVWKRPAPEPYQWFRCELKIPAAWRGKDVRLVVEGVDDAREIHFAGRRIGTLGSFPPRYRSGLEGDKSLAIPADLIRWDRHQTLAIRVYQSQGRTNFNVAAPAIFAGDEAIHLAGKWYWLPGDDAQWQGAPIDSEQTLGAIRYADVRPAEEIRRLRKKLPDEAGPLSPDESLARFRVADDLRLDLVLAEPDIGQPLSIKFDRRGRMWVVQYRQYPNPAGLKMVSRDKFLRTVYDKVPAAPPDHVRGADKITIHEDSDGDGSFDSTKTFVEGLNIATSIAIGRDGVWVLNPPYLLFYPDRNQDDRPDGDPVVHLSGFGLEDTHSVANSLRWGPDGWLYAAQGSTVSGNIVRPGVDEKPHRTMGQLIWRYHPELTIYEVFAEGGGNTFGVEFDSDGRLYSGHNGGDTRGFHYVQGGYYRKGFGKHGPLSNPYSFGFFEAMAHHPVPRFTHTFVIYEGAALPSRYHGKLLGIAPLQSHLVMSDVTADGTSLRTKDVGHPLSSDDPWFRPVDIQVGPDGAVYIADFHEQRIDHASHYQGRVSTETGRIYRLRAKTQGESDGADATATFWDAEGMTTDELVGSLKHPNKWRRQTALRIIADRGDASVGTSLREKLSADESPRSLDLLWALNLLGGVSDETAGPLLSHTNPHVRLWTVRLLCDDGLVTSTTLGRLQSLAAGEADARVRGQLASSARRLPAESCIAIVESLLRHHDDSGDVHVPLLVWWAIESKADDESVDGSGPLLGMLRKGERWDSPLMKGTLLERIMRRYAATGRQADLMRCATLLNLAPTPDHAKILLSGFEAAFEGRSLGPIPAELTIELAKAGGGSRALRIRQGDEAAISDAIRALDEATGEVSERVELIRLLSETKREKCVPALLRIVAGAGDSVLRSAALGALQSYEDVEIGRQVTKLLTGLPEEAREVALSLLVSRPSWAIELLDAIRRGDVRQDSIPQRVVHRLRLLDDPRVRRRVEASWGELENADAETLREEVRRLEVVLNEGSGNPYSGKNLFDQSCGKCHRLFDQGGAIGPDLTAYKRDDLRYMLMNVVNPSLEIREGFENYVIYLHDGRTLTGFVADRGPQVIVLRAADGQTTSVRTTDIEEMHVIPRSLMPENILETYTAQHVRDLFAYLRSSQPLP